MEFFIQKKVDRHISARFTELCDNLPVREQVAEILFWRDIRLQKIEDFVLIMKNMGRADAFVDFEQRMRNIMKVASATLLNSKIRERNPVNRLLVLPEIEAIQKIASIVQETKKMADDSTLGAVDVTQVN